MATYEELHGLHSYQPLRDRVEVAVVIAAQAVFEESAPPQARLDWAKSALENTNGQFNAAYRFVLADSAAATVANIQGASDAAIQSAVDAWRDALYPAS